MFAGVALANSFYQYPNFMNDLRQYTMVPSGFAMTAYNPTRSISSWQQSPQYFPGISFGLQPATWRN